MSAYRLSQISGIPYTTLNELLRGKTKIANCTADTPYRLSKALEVSMEELLLENQEYRSNFETFKSNVCHLVKDQGDLDQKLLCMEEAIPEFKRFNIIESEVRNVC